MSLLSRSLFAQIAFVMTLALLAASAINVAFLVSERSRAGLIETSGPMITRLADLAHDIGAGDQAGRRRLVVLERGERRMVRGGHLAVTMESWVDQRGLRRHDRMERRLRRVLEDVGAEVREVRASTVVVRDNLRAHRLEAPGRATPPGAPPALPEAPSALGPAPDVQTGAPWMRAQRGLSEPPPLNGPGGGGGLDSRPFRDGARAPDGPGLARGRFAGVSMRIVVLSIELADGRWLNADFATPVPRRDDQYQLALSTLVLFAFILGAALWIASRLSRPLKDLAAAAERVGGSGQPEQVAVRGPGDVQRTIEAFNVMSRRVSDLLTEKDATLGALGHDLRTPLTSLRIRLEGLEPEAEREKAIATVEETTALLEAILELARNGRSSEPLETAGLRGLIEEEVAAYRERGAQLSVRVDHAAVAALRPLQFRRLLRNLLDNAIAYAGSAEICLRQEGAEAIVEVADNGPGMPPEALARALQPFVRGDSSRNRGTGGAGLGLALADAIARSLGGSLSLSNRTPHGLLAQVRLPLASAGAT